MSEQDLVASAAALADIIVRENAALEAVELAGAARFATSKQAAAEAFARASAKWSPGRDPELRRIVARLRVLAETNRRLLERGIEVQRRVIETLARAAPPPHGAVRYGATGSLSAARRVTPVALLARA